MDSSEEIKIEEKLFACQNCDKIFLKERSLRNHKRTHKTKINTTCGICEVYETSDKI